MKIKQGSVEEYNHDVVLELIEEYKENRKQLKNMINDVSLLKKSVEALFPKHLDVRNKYLLEEKIKTLVGFYDTILKMRQEINRSIKEEVEMRRKTIDLLSEVEDDGLNIDDLDIEALRKLDKRIKTT